MRSIESVVINRLHCDLFPSELQTESLPNPDAPQFIFTPSGDATCVFTSSLLQCNFVERQLNKRVPQARQFIWSPDHLPVNAFPLEGGRPQEWEIKSAAFLQQKEGKTGLLILITFRPTSRSLLCVFTDLTQQRCKRAISMYGRANLVHLVLPNVESFSFSTSVGAFSKEVFAGVVAIGFERGVIALLGMLTV